MTRERAIKMLEAKRECIKRHTSGIDIDCNNNNCDKCNLNYAQGNMGKQQEALETAIKALEKEPILYKIKEQILDEANYAYADFDRYKEDILDAEPDELPNDDYRYGMHRAFDIINKHISEREVQK